MEQIILIVHVLVALGIIGLIMIQQGKGADMGASFGSGASQTLFGSTGSGNMLTRATTVLVTLFFVTSFGLAVIARDKSSINVDIDIPVPEVVESNAAGDIPSIDESAIDQAMGAGDNDLPEVGTDIPEANY